MEANFLEGLQEIEFHYEKLKSFKIILQLRHPHIREGRGGIGSEINEI